MASQKITKRTVDSAEPHSSRYIVFDRGSGSIPGFGLRVFPSGKKSWVFEYRPGEGGRRTDKKRITIGAAEALTAQQARKIAKRHFSSVNKGEDPQAAKATNRAAMTVAEVVEPFLGDVAAKKKLATLESYTHALRLATDGELEKDGERRALPVIGKMKAKDVRRADIIRLHDALRETPYAANRMVAVIGVLYTFAGKRGFAPETLNPARGVERYREEERGRCLTEDEFARLGDAIREAETTGIPWTIDPTKKVKHLPKNRQATVIGPHAAAAIRLYIFTGARLREVLNLEWRHVNFERGTLDLPDSKTGKKSIPLNAFALEILHGLPRVGAYVIAGGSEGKPRADLKRPWEAVRERAGLDGRDGLPPVRIHDLRHTFASTGAGDDIGLPVIGKMLGHRNASTTQRYAHVAANPLRAAANKIGGRIAEAMGEPPPKGGTVVLFKKTGAA